jgi:hypothetical protein
MPRGGLQTSLVSMLNMLAAPFRRRTSTGPRRGASAGRDAPICRAPVGAHLSRGPPHLQNTRHAQRRQIERYRLSDLIRRAAPRSGMADRPGKPVETKYFIIIVNKFGNGLSSSPSKRRRSTAPLPAFHDDRQCPGAAAAAGGGVRHRAGRAGLRLLDGGAAGLPLGGTVPRQGRAGSRRSAVRPRPRPTISFFLKASRRR